MPQMTLALAETLDPVQAAELVRVLDLEAAWEAAKGTAGEYTLRDLHLRQKSFEEYRARLAAYAASYRTTRVPELSPTAPDRLRVWCQTVRAVAARAGGTEYPRNIVARAYRAADRVAGRLGRPPVERPAPQAPDDVTRALEAIIAWCDGVKPVGPEAG